MAFCIVEGGRCTTSYIAVKANPDLSTATVVAQRCEWSGTCSGWIYKTARERLDRLHMISLVVSVLFLALVLLTSGGTTASGEVDNHEEWGRRIRELRNSGKQEDAIALAEEYCEKVREGHGVEHPRYAIALKVLANILQNTDRTQEAEALLRQSLAIEEKSFGPQHPRLIPTLTELALFLSNKEQIAEARQVFFRLLSIQQSVEAASNQLCNSERQQKVDSVKKQKVEAY